jgi:hypothetical protein
MVAKLASQALDSPFTIQNIGLPITKRQMVASIRAAGFGDLLDFTISCDQFPYQSARKHCGRCSSCLLRAMSMLDEPMNFDKLGDENHSRNRRRRSMVLSSAYEHLKMLGWRIGEILNSSDPLQRYGLVDRDMNDVIDVIDIRDLFAMLHSFQQDISELESLLEGGSCKRDVHRILKRAVGNEGSA